MLRPLLFLTISKLVLSYEFDVPGCFCHVSSILQDKNVHLKTFTQGPTRILHNPPIGMPMPGVIISQGGGEPEKPPTYRPESQAYVVSQYLPPKPPHQYWEEETAPNNLPENKNCMLCENMDSGACRSMPSCVYCEATVTALCERSTPCLRCTVVKNPFFKCTPGEKYMDECDSCRCTDGHGGWCTNMFCEFRPLYIYAMKLSDGEFY